MPAEFSLLQRCLDHAAQAAGPLLGRCLAQATQSMQDAQNRTARALERQELSDACRELVRLAPAWVARFPQELARAAQAAGPTPSAGQPLRLAPLTLVDDDQVVQGIESSRLLQLLLPLLEQPLSELDGLMSAALGLPAVRPESNPLRPEVFAKALQGLMSDSPGQAAAGAQWSRHLAPPLARELAGVYASLVTLLKAADVQAVTYRVLPPSSGPRRAGPGRPGTQRSGMASGDPAPGQAASAPAGRGQGMSGPADRAAYAGPPSVASNDDRIRHPSAWADLGSYDLAHPLMQDFLYRGGSQSQAPLAPAFYARVDEELAGLQAGDAGPAFDPRSALAHRHLPAVDRPQRHVGIDSLLDSQVWGQWSAPRERSLERTRLKRRAERVGQVLGLEVVRKLVNQVAQDPRLLAPVREAIVALEPSLLRLAMVDPRFFSDEEHPGRRLIERVAERSFKFNDEFSAQFAEFADSVAGAFTALNGQQEVADDQPFQAALEGLEASWSAQDAQAQEHHGKVLDAVRFAERRQAEADQIAWELGQRTDLENVPAVVQDFVFGPWALVMAHARLQDTRRQIDPGGYGGVVTDLLWSVKREATLRQPVRLFELIPGLLVRLRNGLAELGQDPAETHTFFAALEKLHRPVLKLRARHRRAHMDSSAAPLQGLDADPALLPAPRQQPRAADQFWMGRKELDAAGFEDTLPSEQAALVDLREQVQGPAAAAAAVAVAPVPMQAAAAAPRPQAPPVQVEQILACLCEGCWVDLSSKGQWLRAELIWASTKRTLFMFVSHGGQPHTMTRRSCEKLVRERLLRPVDTHAVVQHALDTLESQEREPLAA